MAAVREVGYQDREDVARLHGSVGWPLPTERSWRRLWHDNPAAAVGPPRARGWVLEDRNRIVGFLCNLAQNYHLDGRVLRAATASAMVVVPEFRGEALKLVMAFSQQPHVDLLLNTTAAPQTSKIFEFFKFKRIPQPDYDISYYWVLRPARFVTAALRKLGWSAQVSRVAGPLVSPALTLERVWRRRFLGAAPGGMRVSVAAAGAVGAEFDELWRRKLAEGRKLLADRTTATLRWHYSANGKSHPPRIVCAWDGNRLVGYLTIVRRDSPALGLCRAYIPDIFVERDDSETIRHLLAAAARQARGDGAAMIEAVGFPEDIRRIFREYRPFTLRNDAWPFLYNARDPDMHRMLADPTLWRASLFDGDGSV